MSQPLSAIRPQISEELTTCLNSEKNQWNSIEAISTDSLDKLLEFSTRGKMLRGSMVVLLYQMFGGTDIKSAVKVGAAVELLQSTFLIHDDIIDQDRVRRGQPSTFVIYEQEAQQKNYHQATQFGAGMAICLGDIALFLIQKLLAELEIKPEIIVKLLKIFGQEATATCFGQMKDVVTAASPEPVTADDVMAVHLHKTARYTFSLPFLLAAALAEQPQTVIDILDQLSAKLGLIFQIKDDEIGLFGEEAEIGKTAGSDVREGKKTLYYVYLTEKTSQNPSAQQALGYFGDQKLTSEKLNHVRDVVTELGIKTKVEDFVNKLAKESSELIDQLPVAESEQSSLKDLLEYNLLRKK